MVHTAQPYCEAIFMLGTTNEAPKDVPSHQMSVQKLWGSDQGISCRLHIPTCAPMGLMSICLW
jgi:hypothetical protein